jgi:thiaminase (transcriptional activator TenA)
MKFTDSLRRKADELWQQSFQHPFVIELANGTLPTEKFAHYVLNDSYYLTVFAKVQSLGAAKTNDLHTIGRMAFHAESTINAEQALHETFFKILGITRDPDFLPSPTAYRYTTHLLSVAAQGTLGEVIAAILPCYWLYYEIGIQNQDATPNHPIYDKWIATYGDEWFEKLVKEQISRLDELADKADEQEKQRMERHFLISSEYELAFWEMAYRLEKWSF